MSIRQVRFAVLAELLLVLFANVAQAHPKDEFCTVDSGLDPALCAALAEADREVKLDTAVRPGMLDEEQQARVRDLIRFERPWSETAGLHLRLGYEHILPRGLDHILFVLALFLASTRLKSLLIQISVFTVAHTITLGLAAAGCWTRACRRISP